LWAGIDMVGDVVDLDWLGAYFKSRQASGAGAGGPLPGVWDACQCTVKCIQLWVSFQIGKTKAGRLGGQDPEAGKLARGKYQGQRGDWGSVGLMGDYLPWSGATWVRGDMDLGVASGRSIWSAKEPIGWKMVWGESKAGGWGAA